jgi:GDSL-like Lipase/Acylhydrolase family
MRRLVLLVMMAGLSLMAIDGPATAARLKPVGRGQPTYYVALGDSLAGYDPGYPERLATLVREQYADLRLYNVGCPGETTVTLIYGGICPYTEGSQLDEAEAFLDAHQGSVAFITIDIGANDWLNACWDFETGLIDRACTVAVLRGVQANLTFIIHTLRQAAPGVPVLGMTYYSPFLGYWVLPPGHGVARYDLRSEEVLNDGLVETFQGFGVIMADVRGPDAFDVNNFTHRVWTHRWGVVPVNVANACEWTLFCKFGDVHPTDHGFWIIAEAFANALPG